MRQQKKSSLFVFLIVVAIAKITKLQHFLLIYGYVQKHQNLQTIMTKLFNYKR